MKNSENETPKIENQKIKEIIQFAKKEINVLSTIKQKQNTIRKRLVNNKKAFVSEYIDNGTVYFYYENNEDLLNLVANYYFTFNGYEIEN